jgi:hypothetical protein
MTKEILTSAWFWGIVSSAIFYLLPSPVLKKAGDKTGDAIERLAGEKAREISYSVLNGFAEGLKKQKHKVDITISFKVFWFFTYFKFF